MKADNLDDVLRFFNTRERLTDGALHHWFVERQKSPRHELRKWLTIQEQPQKLLFIGHRGSGKSTELNKLSIELQDSFFIIGFDVLEITGRANLEYEDLMLVLSTQVTRQCVDLDLVDRPLLDPIRQRWQDLRDWWQRVVSGAVVNSAMDETNVKVALKLQLLEIETSVRQSAESRETIKREISLRMPELIRYLNWVLQQAQASSGRRPLIIIEGLDKISLKAATTIFLENVPTLLAPVASIVYTCPSALIYSPDFDQIRQPFSRTVVLPNIAPRTDSGKADKTGQDTLRQLVLNRMVEHLIQPDALRQVVLASGGVPRALVALIQNAALFSDGATISLVDVNASILQLRELMRRYTESGAKRSQTSYT
jgi:hypothetical protein